VYQECLTKEFTRAGIPFSTQPELPLHYKGDRLEQTYRADFIGFDKIIIEIKAVSVLAPEHTAQTFNYLKATGHRLAFLVNFCAHGKVHIERIVL
jgi:GxxExxY protein